MMSWIKNAIQLETWAGKKTIWQVMCQMGHDFSEALELQCLK